MIASLSTEESQNMDKLQFIRVFPRALLTNPGRKNKRARDRGGRYDTKRGRRGEKRSLKIRPRNHTKREDGISAGHTIKGHWPLQSHTLNA